MLWDFIFDITIHCQIWHDFPIAFRICLPGLEPLCQIFLSWRFALRFHFRHFDTLPNLTQLSDCFQNLFPRPRTYAKFFYQEGLLWDFIFDITIHCQIWHDFQVAFRICLPGLESMPNFLSRRFALRFHFRHHNTLPNLTLFSDCFKNLSSRPRTYAKFFYQ